MRDAALTGGVAAGAAAVVFLVASRRDRALMVACLASLSLIAACATMALLATRMLAPGPEAIVPIGSPLAAARPADGTRTRAVLRRHTGVPGRARSRAA